MIKTKTNQGWTIYIFRKKIDFFFLWLSIIMIFIMFVLLFALGTQSYQFDCSLKTISTKEGKFNCQIKEYFALGLYKVEVQIANIDNFYVKERRGSKDNHHYLMVRAGHKNINALLNSEDYGGVKYKIAHDLNQAIKNKNDFSKKYKESFLLGYFSLVLLLVKYFLINNLIFSKKNYHDFAINPKLKTIEFYDFYQQKKVKLDFSKINNIKFLKPKETLKIIRPITAIFAVGYNRIKKPVVRGIELKANHKKYLFVGQSTQINWEQFENELTDKISKNF